jgi:thiamine-monophosphate kinase
MTTLGNVGELAAIKRIMRFLPTRADIVRGVGDDCAVVRPHKNSTTDWLLTSDAVVEGTHFVSGTAPELIGHKAIGRVLSDIAAMGGEPQWALIDLVAPRKMNVVKLDGIYRGATRIARRHNLAIVGGDMAEGPVLELHAFAVGTAPKGNAVLRSGARPGDLVYVTGSLGGSRERKHLTFEPRVKEGIFLRKWATSMMDISDGLATDLGHIAEMNDLGVRLYEELIPVSSAARKAGGGMSAVDHALFDGEDFELLFTIPVSRQKAFLRAWKSRFKLECSFFGVMTPKKGTIEFGDTKRWLTKTAFQHFAQP